MPRAQIGVDDDDIVFRLIAKDDSGRVGTHDRDLEFDSKEESLQGSTDRVIYKPGETMNLKIASSVTTGAVYIDVVSGRSVLDSRLTALKDGTAELQIPYSKKFNGELKVSAFIEDPSDDDERISGVAGVIFPHKQGITVDARFNKAIYKPDDEATVRFGIVDEVGKAVESALGVVIFDKAVDERARTDSEFGGMFRGWGGWLGYGNSFGSVNVKELNSLDLSKPLSDEIQLVAEIILRDQYYSPEVFHSKRYYDEAKSVFAGITGKQMGPIRDGLRIAYERQNNVYPTNAVSLSAILDGFGIDFEATRDPWGSAYVAEFSTEKTRDIVTIKSIGPDKVPNTRDDF